MATADSAAKQAGGALGGIGFPGGSAFGFFCGLPALRGDFIVPLLASGGVFGGIFAIHFYLWFD
jgi:hypothetical protein